MSYDNCYNLSQIFEKVVKKNPNKIALRFANVKCTFKDIYNYSNNYINFLNKKKIKNKIIAIYSDKSPSNYYLMIACIRLGLPYTNLDNTIPFARNLKIIKKL
jgi:D-alanine--poly(phosphoribitol) ligase subunit 1